MVAAASLADWVTSALIASLTLMVDPGLRPSLVGAWRAANARHRQLGARRELAAPSDSRTGHRASSSWSARPDAGARRLPADAGWCPNSCPRRWRRQSKARGGFFLAARASPAGASTCRAISASTSSTRLTPCASAPTLTLRDVHRPRRRMPSPVFDPVPGAIFGALARREDANCPQIRRLTWQEEG